MATRRADGTYELDMAAVKQNLEQQLIDDGEHVLQSNMRDLQIVVYVMVGGGLLGHSAATQPSGFYVDSRCKRRPYKLRDIKQSVQVLAVYAEVLNLKQPLHYRSGFHNCGVF